MFYRLVLFRYSCEGLTLGSGKAGSEFCCGRVIGMIGAFTKTALLRPSFLLRTFEKKEEQGIQFLLIPMRQGRTTARGLNAQASSVEFSADWVAYS